MSLDQYFQELRATHHVCELVFVNDGASSCKTTNSQPENSSRCHRRNNSGPPSVPARRDSHDALDEVLYRHSSSTQEAAEALHKFYKDVAPTSSAVLSHRPTRSQSFSVGMTCKKNQSWGMESPTRSSSLTGLMMGKVLLESSPGKGANHFAFDEQRRRIVSECLLETEQILVEDKGTSFPLITTPRNNDFQVTRKDDRWSSRPSPRRTNSARRMIIAS